MKGDWLENKLNERFENFDSEMDLGSEWASLERLRRPERKKRDLLPFWFGGAGILLVMLAMCLYMIYPKNTEAVIHQSSSLSKTNGQNTQKSLFPENEIKETIDPKTKLEKTSSVNVVAAPSIKTLLEKKSRVEKPLFINPIGKQQNTEINAHDSPKELEFNSIVEPYSIPDLAKQTLKTEISKAPFITPLGINYLEQKRANQSEIPFDISEKNSNRNHSSSSFGLTGVYGKHFRTLTAIHTEEETFITRRNSHETPLDYYHLQVNFQKRTNQGFIINSYLGFQQSMDLLTDNNLESSNIVLEDQVTRINRYSDGTEEMIMGNIEAEKLTTTQALLYHRHQNISLGLLAGQSLAKRYARNGFNLLGGFEFVLNNRSTGMTYASAESINSYIGLNELDYKGLGQIRALLRLEFFQKLNNHTEIGIGINAKADLINAYQNGLYSEKRQFFGSFISIRKDL